MNCSLRCLSKSSQDELAWILKIIMCDNKVTILCNFHDISLKFKGFFRSMNSDVNGPLMERKLSIILFHENCKLYVCSGDHLKMHNQITKSNISFNNILLLPCHQDHLDKVFPFHPQFL